MAAFRQHIWQPFLNPEGQIVCSKNLNKPVNRWLAFLLALPLAFFCGSPVMAQDASQGDALDDDALEEIIVTGSRLARTGFDTPSPVVVIGDPEIRGAWLFGGGTG